MAGALRDGFLRHGTGLSSLGGSRVQALLLGFQTVFWARYGLLVVGSEVVIPGHQSSLQNQFYVALDHKFEHFLDEEKH